MRLLALVILIMVALLSCQHQHPQSDETGGSVTSNSGDCRTIQHEMGETEICGQPERIVVLGPYTLEPLLALKVQPVGYADHVSFQQGDYTEPSQQIPYLGDLIPQPIANVGSAYTPSIESILKLQPDLILGIDEMEASNYETLSNIAPTLWLDYDLVAENLRTIANAVNRSEQAEQLLTQTQQQIASARETFAPLVATYPKVALLGSSELQTINVFTDEAGLCSSLIESLGFQLVLPPGLDKNASGRSIPISLETLLQLNEADLIILLGNNFSNFKQLNGVDQFENHQLSKVEQAWKKNEVAQSLDASKAGRVYFIPTYLCGAYPGVIGTELYLEARKQQLLAPN